MRWVFVLFMLAPPNGEAQRYQPGSFGALRASLPTLDLPLQISGESLHPPGMSPVGEEWFPYLPGASPYYGCHYVIGALELHDSVEVLLYEMASPAGGYSTVYHLLTYDPSGSLLGRARVAEVSGSLEHDAQSAVTIDERGRVAGTIITTRCGEDDSVVSRETETVSLIVLPSGTVRHD